MEFEKSPSVRSVLLIVLLFFSDRPETKPLVKLRDPAPFSKGSVVSMGRATRTMTPPGSTETVGSHQPPSPWLGESPRGSRTSFGRRSLRYGQFTGSILSMFPFKVPLCFSRALMLVQELFVVNVMFIFTTPLRLTKGWRWMLCKSVRI